MAQITSRAEFQARLDKGLADMARLLQRSPGHPPYEEVEAQLRGLKQWTASGREPTPDERKKITIGLLVIRQFDPQPELWLYEIMENLNEIQGYVRIWPPDGEAPYKL